MLFIIMNDYFQFKNIKKKIAEFYNEINQL